MSRATRALEEGGVGALREEDGGEQEKASVGHHLDGCEIFPTAKDTSEQSRDG